MHNILFKRGVQSGPNINASSKKALITYPDAGMMVKNQNWQRGLIGLLYILLYVMGLPFDLGDTLDIVGDMTELVVFIVDAIDDDSVGLSEGEPFVCYEGCMKLSVSGLYTFLRF